MENSNELAKNFRLTRNSPGRGGGGAPGHLLTGGASENPSHFLRGRGATVVFFWEKNSRAARKNGGRFRYDEELRKVDVSKRGTVRRGMVGHFENGTRTD